MRSTFRKNEPAAAKPPAPGLTASTVGKTNRPDRATGARVRRGTSTELTLTEPTPEGTSPAVVDIATRDWPAVGVVLATHNRPQLMRQALASILEQDYAGPVEIVLVFDRSEPDHSLVRQDPDRRVSVISNTRTPGLAGARNSGVLHLSTQIVGFCDDDDTWLPGKLAAQVTRLLDRPTAQFCTTAMRVDFGDRSTVRLATKDQVTLQDMARSRMAMLHSSSFLFRREAMIDGFGLVDETLPRSMAEDWDLLIRAARRAPIENVDEPLVAILWGASSYFNDAWKDKNEAHAWLIEHHEEILQDSIGAGLLYGKLAFGSAVLGERRAALGYARRSARSRWREPRGYLALLVLAGVSGQWIQEVLNKRGHGI
jgi:glycosyltransferase involved in cell wall biosynthesis